MAREALSARIDGEREPVPSARVDEHLDSCPLCASWYAKAEQQALQLRRMAAASRVHSVPIEAPDTSASAAPHRVLRCALGVVGMIQLGLAVAQAAGVDFGMVAAHHGTTTGAHLLNESSAWSAALGVAAIAAAIRPPVALGLSCVLVAYAALLSYYVVADLLAGQVTTLRVVSHLPVAAATLLALLVWRTHRPQRPSPGTGASGDLLEALRRHPRGSHDSAA